MPTTPSHDSDQLLGIYLADHRAGAAAGLALARRVRDATDESDYHATLVGLVDHIESDRLALDGLIERLGVTQNPLKSFIAAAGERIGRLKLNGRFLQRSPLSPLEELELLTLGLTGKTSLWRSLESAAIGRDDIDRAEMRRRADGSAQQLTVLERHRPALASAAFG